MEAVEPARKPHRTRANHREQSRGSPAGRKLAGHMYFPIGRVHVREMQSGVLKVIGLLLHSAVFSEPEGSCSAVASLSRLGNNSRIASAATCSGADFFGHEFNVINQLLCFFVEYVYSLLLRPFSSRCCNREENSRILFYCQNVYRVGRPRL